MLKKIPKKVRDDILVRAKKSGIKKQGLKSYVRGYMQVYNRKRNKERDDAN